MRLFILLVGLLLVGGVNGQTFKLNDLFVGGTYQTHTYRIPALEVTTKGTVIAVCDARRDNGKDLPGNIDLVMRRSFDHGNSWEPMRVILDLTEKHGCGDPSLVVDRITGRIFCFYAYAPLGISIRNAQPGNNSADDPTTQHVQYIFSDDDGTSWSEPIDLNPWLKAKEWEGLFASSGHGIQTRSGRLLQPLVIKYDQKGDGTFQTHARNAYSDDHGKTWNVGSPVGLQVGETKVVELSDGTVMQNMRNRKIRYRSVSLSEDGGNSFNAMTRDSTLIGPRCNASITRFKSVWEGDAYNMMVFSNPASQQGRMNMTLRFSFDDATTWPLSLPIYEGPSAYSSVIRLYDGGLGLLFENGKESPYEKISFVKIPKTELDSILQSEAILKRPGFTPYYYHRSHQFGLLPDTEDEVIFLGNSISDGAEWHEYLQDSRMKNRGISGDVTRGVLMRLNDITRIKPAKVFLLIGINDLARGKHTKEVINNHRKIYEQIKAESPDTQLYVQSLLPVNNFFGKFSGHTSKSDSVAIVNKALKVMAREMGHTFVDLETAMKDNEGKLRKDLTEDGLHLNGRGYQVWVNLIKRYFDEP
ncbi:hypothetical protein EYV94_11625 [Puteibacter caeruleilacunae]|nr:hypothetical protein EYV94_11625 [Puteibacter caeruleilacunae]